jgi:hypothetical protein
VSFNEIIHDSEYYSLVKRIVLTLSALVNAANRDHDAMPRCHTDGNSSVREAACGIPQPGAECIEVPELKSLN